MSGDWGFQKKPIISARGMVVAKHPLAADVGREVLEAGGNALDAAIATGFAVGVVEPEMSGIGGVGLGLVYQEGRVTVIDGGPVSPHDLDPGRYPLDPQGQDDDLFGWPRVVGGANLLGPTSVAVPSMVAVMGALYRQGARLSWERLLAPAIRMAREGVPASWLMVLHLVESAQELSRFAGTRATYFPEGRVPVYDAGDRLTHVYPYPALADTLEQIAGEGPEAFYHGRIARGLAEFMRVHQGFLSEQDLEAYQVRHSDQPIRVDLGAYAAWFPDGLNGGVSMAEILELWKCMADEGASPEDKLTAWIRAGRAAFSDRLRLLGEGSRCSDGLLDPAYIKKRAVNWQSPVERGPLGDSTTHLVTVDADGNGVSLNLTLLSQWGSKVVVPTLGVLLNNGIMWFDPRPGAPNSLRPGTHALANMAPAVVTRDGRLEMLLGASGGRRIVAALPQMLVTGVLNGFSMQDAIEAPRLDFSQVPVLVDPRLGAEACARLQESTGVDTMVRPRHLGNGGYASPVGVKRRRDDAFESGVDPMTLADARAPGEPSR